MLGNVQATLRFTGCNGVHCHLSVSEAELVDLYQRADALLLPVTGATANNAVLESLACGTPVISTDVGGIPEIFGPLRRRLIPANDVGALSARLIDMLTAPHAQRAGRTRPHGAGPLCRCWVDCGVGGHRLLGRVRRLGVRGR